MLGLLTSAGGCDTSDDETLTSVFGDGADTFQARDVVTVGDGVDAADAGPDLDLPRGACAELEIVEDNGPARTIAATRCEFARQDWRGLGEDVYFTLFLETDIVDTTNEGVAIRDVVQIVLDDVPASGPLETGDYTLAIREPAPENFAIYSPRSDTLASTAEDPATAGEPHGTVTILDGQGSTGRFELTATSSGTRYTIIGRYAATLADARLPEPAPR